MEPTELHGVLCARVFFNDGQIETRPFDWILFTSETEFVSMGEEEVKKLQDSTHEVFVVFLERVKCIQIFKGDFVDVRSRRDYKHDRDSRDHSNHRRP